MWERISCVYFRPRGANFCPMFIASLQPEILSAIDWSLPTPAHECKAPGTNESARGFANSCKFNQVAFLNFGFYHISLSVQLVIDAGEKRKVAATFKKAKSANLFRLHGTGAFSCGVPFHVGCLFLYGCLLTRCGCCNQNGCLYSWGAYFVWVLIILILWYQEYMILWRTI